MIFQEKCFSCYILLTDQISLFDCLYFLRYWAICVIRLFVNQAVTLRNLKSTLSFYSSRFATWPKSQDKNLNILRTKKDFEVKLKAFSIIFKGLSIVKNFPRPKSALLKKLLLNISQNSRENTCTGVRCEHFPVSFTKLLRVAFL